MTEITPAALLDAARILLGAPVRGAPPAARFVEAASELAVLVDHGTRRIGEALALAAREADARATVVLLDRQEKPLRALPAEAREALARASCVVFAASSPNAERSMREQIAAVVKAREMRYARLPDVSEAAFARGLRLDHRKVARLGREVEQRVQHGHLLEVTSPAGTSLRIAVTPGAWVERFGELVPGSAVGFPAGALYTSPESIDGTFVADASLGEFFGAREGVLTARPVRFEIAAGRVTSVEAPGSPALEADLRALLAFAENSNRIGLVVLGVNAGVEGPTGDAGVDQCQPGLHLGLGDPGGKSTAVAWKARTAFAACQTASHVRVDARVLFDGGRLVE
ncbi:MAG TPA: hypothetical protein VLT33_42175 [Labilithrix sp.]|nr:hypothetical protein [Labilithrix sp.]